MILRLAFKPCSASPRRRLRPVMACLWPGYGWAWSLFGAIYGLITSDCVDYFMALHMPKWVLKVKDVITCPCNNMLGYCCLIEC